MSLDDHRPSERVQRLAAARGIDLDALRRDDPEQYMMINAEPLLWLSPELLPVAGEVLGRLLPGHRMFTVPSTSPASAEGDAPELLRLLVFPPLSKAELRHVDEALAQAVVAPSLAERHPYYREVRDRRGLRRELRLPRSPEQAAAGDLAEGLIGPFVDEAAAQAWAERILVGRPGITYDLLPYGGAWFVDAFAVDEDAPAGRS